MRKSTRSRLNIFKAVFSIKKRLRIRRILFATNTGPKRISLIFDPNE